MLNAIVTGILQARINADSFEKPGIYRIAGMVQHILIESHMTLHRMGPQAVGKHDVIDVIISPLYSVVQFAKRAAGAVVRDRFDPGHGTLRSRLPSGFDDIVLQTEHEPNNVFTLLLGYLQCLHGGTGVLKKHRPVVFADVHTHM